MACMKYNQVVEQIVIISNDDSLDFTKKSAKVQQQLDDCSKADIQNHLLYAGVIPECFAHDSTEEKLFAKYCDSLLARALCELGLDAHAIKERADAADVLAKGGNYTLVGDAKAFRLSRTAKNQKDFKVEALNQWRKGADFACLVAPLNQYPNSNSQIYAQATRYNVAILSYTHLWFLIEHSAIDGEALKQLWTLAGTLTESKSAVEYWKRVGKLVLKITTKSIAAWEAALKASAGALRAQSKTQIEFWEDEKKRLAGLSKDKLAEELVEALKINSKIDQIKKAVGS